ncbi:PAS domain-containing protein [Pontibacter sp. G13]|uniref:PAS domain-containing protein n=1 Tax=Pontibacter sp. G13 TaxID=3074898 RepID=UPI00288BE112|nr:PAS domain-containing protein [Pontibacter sp. G13]WNJ18410.1 PAS domain-containing protein [Pontibacter sp. G13]
MGRYREDLRNMMGLDLFLANPQNHTTCYSFEKKASRHPLSVWDWAGSTFWRTEEIATTDRQVLLEYAELFGWKVDLDELLSIPHEALVLTDADQTIQWVNGGFETMTGFEADYALGRSPKFLQGPSTKTATRQDIRTKLSNGEVYVGEITNYRKSQESYICKVTITPIFNQEDQLSHFLALEMEGRSQAHLN